MKSMRWILPGLALAALLGNGCIIVSAQIFANYALPSVAIDNTGTPDQVFKQDVDLSTVSDYTKNKDKLKGLSDLAVVGKFSNQSGPAVAVEFWITPSTTAFTTGTAVKAGATKLWGGLSLGAASATRTVGWDESAKLFNSAGKKILIDETLGDGKFTLYALVTGPGPNLVHVDNGQILLVIDAGK